jgi:hypothetical protein
MAANCFILGSDWLDAFKLLTGSGPKADMAWLGTDAPPSEAGLTAKHHSLVTYQGHGMVQQQEMRCNGCKLLHFGLRLA